jgi:pimeloyl-ACP methyl ester carboxylesterase
VYTQDQVAISGVHLANGYNKAVIVCHGGGRSKDILGNVMICEWFADYYDVVTFDFRGHGASSGTLAGDGRTAEDLNTVIEYTRGHRYERIGVVGRSLGGWSAILEAARYQNVDSVVAAGVPLGGLDDIPAARALFSKGILPFLGRALARILVGVRISDGEGQVSPMSVIDKVSPIPLLLIYCEEDPTANMWKDDIEKLYSKAREPKQLTLFDGRGHILEARYLARYFALARQWFDKTL